MTSAARSQIALRPEVSGSYIDRLLRVQTAFRICIFVLGLAYTWCSRFAMNADGVSYLDIGDEYWRGSWGGAINLYWSPLYSWLTGFVLRVSKPALRWEFPAVHALNLVIFIATLFAFEFFWRELLVSHAGGEAGDVRRQYLWIFGYAVFVYVHIAGGSLSLVTPDLIVGALVYVAAGLVLRLTGGVASAYSATALGATLGVGYLAKAAMFPFALMVLASTAIAMHFRGLAKRLILVSVAAFVLVAAPLLMVLSAKSGHITFGDSAKLNQAWFVNGVSLSPYEHRGASNPQFVHPIRLLYEAPELYEFATPIAGTYPPWYDPAYWNAGPRTTVNLRSELRVFRRTMFDCTRFLLSDFVLVTGALLIIIFSANRTSDCLRRLRRYWAVWCPAMLVFVMYGLVRWEPRFVSGFLVVLAGLAVVAAAAEEGQKIVLRAAAITLSCLVLCNAVLTIHGASWENREAAMQLRIAEQLQGLGIQPGDRVAIIGDGVSAYWARLAKTRIVAEVPGVNSNGNPSAAEFWHTPADRQAAIMDAIKKAGARAVVGDPAPEALPDGWKRIAGTKQAVKTF